MRDVIKKIIEDFKKLSPSQQQDLIRHQGENLARNYRPGPRQAYCPPQHSVKSGDDGRLKIMVEVDKHILSVQELDEVLKKIRQQIMREIIEPQELWQEQNRS